MKNQAFQVDVGVLRINPGSRKPVERSGSLAELATSGGAVAEDEPVRFEGFAESIGGGVVVKGVVHARWSGECRRCLTTATGEFHVEAHEVFEDRPTEGETYPIVGHTIDLGALVREAVMLELPIAAVCREACAGFCATCGADRNEAPCNCADEVIDARWAALDELKE